MKVSVFTVCMPEYGLAETTTLVAKAGYDGVEWRVQRLDPALASEPPSYWRHNKSTINLDTVVEQAPAVRELACSAGLEMPSLASYVPLGDYDSAGQLMRAARVRGVAIAKTRP